MLLLQRRLRLLTPTPAAICGEATTTMTVKISLRKQASSSTPTKWILPWSSLHLHQQEDSGEKELPVNANNATVFVHDAWCMVRDARCTMNDGESLYLVHQACVYCVPQPVQTWVFVFLKFRIKMNRKHPKRFCMHSYMLCLSTFINNLERKTKKKEKNTGCPTLPCPAARLSHFQRCNADIKCCALMLELPQLCACVGGHLLVQCS